jgi:hypothetical protein
MFVTRNFYKMRNLTYLIFMLFLISCNSLVTDELEQCEKVPVLNGLLQADSIIKVQIAFSASLSDSSIEYIDNAEIVINCNEISPDTLQFSGNGWYVSSKVAKPGTDYYCKVKIPGYPLMESHAFVPEYTAIDTVVFTDLAGRGEEGQKISSIEFSIVNDKSKELFWEVQLITNRELLLYNETKQEMEFITDELIENIDMTPGQDSVLLNETAPLNVFSNKKIKDTNYRIKFNIDENSTHFDLNSKSFITLKSVDKSYYRYLKQYYIYKSGQSPAIGQTSQKYSLYSNVVNGLGLFAGIAVTRKQLIVN